MATKNTKLTNSNFHNWIKLGLALLYTKEAIQDDVKQELITFHRKTYEDIIKSKGLPVGRSCTSCTTKSIMICDQSNRLCKKIGKRCQTKHAPCPQNICDEFRDRIVKAHRFSEPSFKNSDSQKWCVDYIEVLKCFMPLDGYADKSTIEEMDFNGIISILINFNNFQNKTSENLSKKNNIFDQARNIGRQFRHTTTFEITDADFNKYVDTLADILKDPKYFATLKKSQEAVEKLEKLRSDPWTITSIAENKELQEIIVTIKEQMDTFLECHKKMTDDSVAAIESARHETETWFTGSSLFEKSITDIVNKLIQENEETRLKKIVGESLTSETNVNETDIDGKRYTIPGSDNMRQIHGKVNQESLSLIPDTQSTRDKDTEIIEERGLSEEITIVDKEAVEFQGGAKETSIKQALAQLEEIPKRRFIEHKRVLRRRLIQKYEQKYAKLQVSPLLEEEDAPLLDIYVKPFMSVHEHHKVQSREIEVNSYYDVFFKNNRECKNIYVTGGVGIGKTAFCQRIALAWCCSHSCQPQSQALKHMCIRTERVEDTENTYFSPRDLETIKSFEFLFYISLRDTNLCHVEEIIIQQITCIQDATLLSNILHRNKCLIVMDGLDEWSHPLTQTPCPSDQKVPHRQAYQNCTFLTTSRSSKLDMVRLGTSEIDQQVVIKGIDNHSYKKLVFSVVNHFNSSYNAKKDPKIFVKILEKNHLLDLTAIPIVLTQLICQWCDDVSLNTCKSIVYGKTLEMLFVRSKAFDTEKERVLSVEALSFPERWKTIPLLQQLAWFAFSTLFSVRENGSELVFNLESDEQSFDCLTSANMTQLCSVGIISRSKVTEKITKRKVKLQFIHRSFHEFMTAVCIAIDFRDTFSLQSTMTSKFAHIADFLEHSNVLVFLASLCPDVLLPLNQQLLKELCMDEQCVEYRKLHYPGFMSYKTNTRYDRYRECNSNLKALQALWTTCLRERARSIPDDKIFQENHHSVSPEAIYQDNKQLGHKQTNHQDNERYSNINAVYQLTDIFIEDEAPDIKCLLQASAHSLLSVSTCCFYNELTSADKLIKFHIVGPSCVEAVGLLSNFTHLQCLVISNCTLQTDFSLQYLAKLKTLNLFDAMLTHSNLCNVKAYCEKQHTLNQISLVYIECTDHVNLCCTLELNCSRHRELVTLELRRTPVVAVNINTFLLESCIIETQVQISPDFIKCLENSLKLQYLTIELSDVSENDRDITKSFCEALVNTLPTLVSLKYLKLVNVDIGDNILKLSPRMKSLEQLKLWWVALTCQSLENLINTLPKTLGIINVELVVCKMKSGRKSRRRNQLKKIASRVRIDESYLVTKCNTAKGQLLTLYFQSVDNLDSTNQ